MRLQYHHIFTPAWIVDKMQQALLPKLIFSNHPANVIMLMILKWLSYGIFMVLWTITVTNIQSRDESAPWTGGDLQSEGKAMIMQSFYGKWTYYIWWLMTFVSSLFCATNAWNTVHICNKLANFLAKVHVIARMFVAQYVFLYKQKNYDKLKIYMETLLAAWFCT